VSLQAFLVLHAVICKPASVEGAIDSIGIDDMIVASLAIDLIGESVQSHEKTVASAVIQNFFPANLNHVSVSRDEVTGLDLGVYMPRLCQHPGRSEDQLMLKRGFR
jgi:hypothetical protein